MKLNWGFWGMNECEGANIYGLYLLSLLITNFCFKKATGSDLFLYIWVIFAKPITHTIKSLANWVAASIQSQCESWLSLLLSNSKCLESQ